MAQEVGHALREHRMTLGSIGAGTATYTWTVTAYVGTITRTTSAGQFRVCAKGGPGAVTLGTPEGEIRGTRVTFAWTLETWGSVCDHDAKNLVYELYIRESGGASAVMLGSCLATQQH